MSPTSPSDPPPSPPPSPPPGALPRTMAAAVLTGHGGLDRLEYRTDVPVPAPGPGEVLIRVAAASVNNTDVNTRTGWYSKTVSGQTADTVDTDAADASWNGRPLAFPLIQGADCCGRIVALGDGVPASRLGERVILRSLQTAPPGAGPDDLWTFGSERDGAFAGFCTAPSADAFAVESELSDVELGAVGCAYGTAGGMLRRAGVGAADRVLVTGASGGVGAAAVQLAKLRGAHVIAVCGSSKADAVAALGADETLDRDADLVGILGREAVTVVADLVAGPGWPALLEVLARGGRYVCAGAIAGPIVELDVRTLYLRDLTLYGCARQGDEVFDELVGHLGTGALRPAVAATWPLSDVVAAQERFLAKDVVGKIVLVPPDIEDQ